MEIEIEKEDRFGFGRRAASDAFCYYGGVDNFSQLLYAQS